MTGSLKRKLKTRKRMLCYSELQWELNIAQGQAIYLFKLEWKVLVQRFGPL